MAVTRASTWWKNPTDILQATLALRCQVTAGELRACFLLLLFHADRTNNLGHKRVLRSGFSAPFRRKSIRFGIRCPNHSRKHKKSPLWFRNSAETPASTGRGEGAEADRDVRSPAP